MYTEILKVAWSSRRYRRNMIAGHASLRAPKGLINGAEYIALIASILLLGGILLPVHAQSTEQAKLTASDAASEDDFGRSVSISGDTAIIGSPLDDDGGSSSGSAYLFVRIAGTWTEQAKLTADDAAAGDLFGDSVSISGDTAIIGATKDEDPGSLDSGSAYVFVRSAGTWTGQAKLTATEAAAEDNFGFSVSISGDTAVVGSIGDDDGGSSSGSAYVYVLLPPPAEVDPVDAGVPEGEVALPADVVGSPGTAILTGGFTGIIVIIGVVAIVAAIGALLVRRRRK